MERGIWLPNIFGNCYVYNFKVIAYQIELHHCQQIISLNQLIWSSMLMKGKTNQLSWYKNSSKFLFKNFFFSLNISDFSKHCNHPEKGHHLFRRNPLIKLKSYKILNFLKFAGKFKPPQRKRGFTTILKNFQKRTKPLIRRHVHYEYLFYKGWEKQLLAEMIYKHKEIRCTCLAWCFKRMELAKGHPPAVVEPGILLFKSYCLRIEE